MYSLKPNSLWLNIIDSCNNRCEWCYQKSVDRTDKSMSLSRVKSIIDAARKIGVKDCVLIGGEPTIHPDIMRIVKLSKDSGLRTIIISNGRFPSRKNFINDLISSNPDAINISLHGWSEDSYFELTGARGGFKQVAESVNLLYDNNVNLGTAFVISKLTAPYLTQAVESFSKIGVKSIEFNMASPSISRKGIDGSYMLPLEEQKKSVMKAVAECLNYNIEPGFNLNIPHCLFSEEELSILTREAKITSGCSMRNGSGIIFNVRGGLTVCNHFTEFELISAVKFDDIFQKDNFMKFWNSYDVQSIRQEVTCFHHNSCRECRQWEQCGGGCPINWMHFDPENSHLNPIFFQIKGGEKNEGSYARP